MTRRRSLTEKVFRGDIIMPFEPGVHELLSVARSSGPLDAEALVNRFLKAWMGPIPSGNGNAITWSESLAGETMLALLGLAYLRGRNYEKERRGRGQGTAL